MEREYHRGNDGVVGDMRRKDVAHYFPSALDQRLRITLQWRQHLQLIELAVGEMKRLSK